MKITFDDAKNKKNIEDRKLSFELVYGFDFESAIYAIDTRRDYGEIRRRALGLMALRVYALVFVETTKGIRVISFRKANKREVTLYEQKNKN